MQEERLKDLLSKYISNSISKDELSEFLELIHPMMPSDFFALIAEFQKENAGFGAKDFLNSEKVFESIRFSIQELDAKSDQTKVKSLFPQVLKYAAILLLTGCISAYFLHRFKSGNQLALTAHTEIYLRNSNQPILKLANGRQLDIVDAKQLELSKLGLELKRSASGEVLYKVNSSVQANEGINTFICPKGSSLKLALADGTIAFLNAGSELSYPAQFADAHQRKVAMKGEIYFEVAHEKNRPFIVEAKQTIIKVLGTKFNIDADDKTSTTTLMTGKVEVSARDRKKVLQPGYQAVIKDSSDDIVIEKANLKDVMAWQEGYFRFVDNDIQTVLLKIKDWYAIDDFEIVAKNNDVFTGMLRRTYKLSDLLSQLESISNYKFKIQDGRVLVM